MVREAAAANPFVPEVPGSLKPLVRRGERLRRGAVTPGQGTEHLLTRPQPTPGDRPRPLETQVQIGDQPDRQFPLPVGHFCLPLALSGMPPDAAPAAVAESRLALQYEVDGAAQAPDGTQQHLLRRVISRHPLVSARPAGFVAPWPDEQDIPDHRPARWGIPRGL